MNLTFELSLSLKPKLWICLRPVLDSKLWKTMGGGGELHWILESIMKLNIECTTDHKGWKARAKFQALSIVGKIQSSISKQLFPRHPKIYSAFQEALLITLQWDKPMDLAAIFRLALSQPKWSILHSESTNRPFVPALTYLGDVPEDSRVHMCVYTLEQDDPGNLIIWEDQKHSGIFLWLWHWSAILQCPHPNMKAA